MLTVPLVKTDASLLSGVTAEACLVEGMLGMEPREGQRGEREGKVLFPHPLTAGLRPLNTAGTPPHCPFAGSFSGNGPYLL